MRRIIKDLVAAALMAVFVATNAVPSFADPRRSGDMSVEAKSTAVLARRKMASKTTTIAASITLQTIASVRI